MKQEKNQFSYDNIQRQLDGIAIQTQKPRQRTENKQKKQVQSEEFKNIDSQKMENKLEQSENQQEEEYDKIDIDSLVPKISNRQKLIQQNIKLKTQIYDLAKQIDEITRKPAKDKQQKAQDPMLKSKKLELKKHQIHLMQIRNKIFNTKHQIERYDMVHINTLQDKINAVKLQIQHNLQEKNALQIVSKSQATALETKMPQQLEQKFKQNKQLLKSLKETHKDIYSRLVQNQRTIRKSHQQVIIKTAKIKQMQQNIALNQKQKQKQRRRSKSKPKGKQQRISSSDIVALQQQIETMRNDKKQSDQGWLKKIKLVEGEINSKRLQQEKKMLIVKEKEKQLKLYEIKLKQLNRLLKPVEIKKQTDMSAFKYKRNIKYLDK